MFRDELFPTQDSALYMPCKEKRVWNLDVYVVLTTESIFFLYLGRNETHL